MAVTFTAAITGSGLDSARAQSATHLHEHPVLTSIQDARETGELTNDEAILQMHYAAYRPELLNEEFRDEQHGTPIKCMVPIAQEYEELRSELKGSTVAKIDEMTASTSYLMNTEHSYVSPSGKFVFNYNTTGSNAVPDEQTLPGAIAAGIPDYIYKAAFAADSSYRYQVEQVGFTNFSKETPYEVRFSNFGFYGTTTSSGSTSYITLHHTFNGFPENSHPEGNQIGALYVTLAHEIKHAIQYEANRWRGSAGSFNWIEMDATLMEEVVFDDVNDYYNYIKNGFNSSEASQISIFGAPENPTPGAYYHITWMLYFTEMFGIDFWVDTWEIVESDPLISFTEAIDTILAERQSSLSREHIMNHLWHMGSGESFAASGFGFDEREFYPDSFKEFSFFMVPDSVAQTNLRPFGANYIRATSPGIAIGRPAVRVESTSPGVGIGVVGLFSDGSARSQLYVDELSESQLLTTNWDWSQLDDLYIAVVNTSQNRTADYMITLESVVPEVDILARNYPNPFNPSTRIEFSLSSPKDVRLDVFDSIGRRVTTLVNEPLGEGFHFVDFDGSNLASGVYLYRIKTNDNVLTQKMLLVK